MKIDKHNSIIKKRRIKEKNIWKISIIGGCLGTALGMIIFHHKNRHINFLIGLPTILILWFILLYCILKYINI